MRTYLDRSQRKPIKKLMHTDCGYVVLKGICVKCNLIPDTKGIHMVLECPRYRIAMELVHPKQGEARHPRMWRCHKCEYEYMEPR